MVFQLILADKPQLYQNRHLERKDGTKTRFGIGAAGNYDVVADLDICSWPIHRLADPAGCILASWGTCPNTPFDCRVIEAWGFSYATVGFTWLKTNKNDGQPFAGVGGYTMSNIEDLYLAVSREEMLAEELERLVFARFGDRNPERAHKDLRQVQSHPHVRYDLDHPKVLSGEKRVGERIHSGKPLKFHHLLDRLYGDCRKIELFARPGNPADDASVAHWYRTGNEYDGLDVQDAITLYGELPGNPDPSEALMIATTRALELQIERRKDSIPHDPFQ